MGQRIRMAGTAVATALALACPATSAAAAPAAGGRGPAIVVDDYTDRAIVTRYDADGRVVSRSVERGHAPRGDADSSTSSGAATMSCINEGSWSRNKWDTGATVLRWLSNPVYRFNLSGMPSSLTASSFKNAVIAGENQWETGSNACGGRDVSGFAASTSTDIAKPVCTRDSYNIVGFRRETSIPEGDTGPLVARACMYGDANNNIVETDIYFNTYWSFCTNGGSGCHDVQSVAAHEFGHLLGLGHVPSDVGAVMYPGSARGDTSHRRLSLGDLEGVARLYPNSTPLYAATYVSRTYDNPAGSTAKLSALHPYSARVVMTNSGGLPWAHGGRVRLATLPTGRVSKFYTSWDWLSTSRVTQIDAGGTNGSVPPGQNATFDFQLTPDRTLPGTTTSEDFQLIAEGIAAMSADIPAYSLAVGRYDGTVVGQSPFVTLVQGVDNPAYVDVQNTGDAPWFADRTVVLGTANPHDRCSAYAANDWSGCRRPGPWDANLTTAGSQIVQPGEVARFAFNMTAPFDPFEVGQRRSEWFEPLAESVNWFGSTAAFDFTIAAGSN